jgi:hypothetical protein
MNKLQMQFLEVHITHIRRIADALERIAKVMEEEKLSKNKEDNKKSN